MDPGGCPHSQCRLPIVQPHDAHAHIGHTYSQPLQGPDLLPKEQGRHHQHHGGIQVQDGSLQTGTDVLQAHEVQGTGQVIAAKAQADHLPAQSARQFWRHKTAAVSLPRCPPDHHHEQGQGHCHAHAHHRDGIRSQAIHHLGQDRLTRERHSPSCGAQQAFNTCRSSHQHDSTLTDLAHRSAGNAGELAISPSVRATWLGLAQCFFHVHAHSP